MPQEAALLVNEQRLNIGGKSFSVDRGELRRFLEILQERVLGTVELEMVNPLLRERTVDEVDVFRRDVRAACILFVTVSGLDGNQLNGSVSDVFDSPNFPDEVATLYVDSATKFRNQNYTPRNSMKLLLDFQKPAIFNFNLERFK